MPLFLKVLFLLVFFINISGYECFQNNGNSSFLKRYLKNSEPKTKKILLTLYFEGKAGDSTSFILNQLEPAMKRLEDFVSVKYIPFGRSKSVQGGKKFICPFGPKSCTSNRIMDCALNHLMNTPDSVKLDYVTCEMRTEAAARGSFECVHNNPKVESCANSEKGIALQLNSEYLTQLLSPRHVPAFTINGVFDPNVQMLAMSDLFTVLCDKLRNVKPCNGPVPWHKERK